MVESASRPAATILLTIGEQRFPTFATSDHSDHGPGAAEAVNGLYEAELIHARPAWPLVTEVEFGTLRWVRWWNTERLHENPDC